MDTVDIANADDANNKPRDPSIANCDHLQVSCNWQIVNDKQFHHAITTAPLSHASTRINCEDVVSLYTCIALQPMDSKLMEPCMLDIKMTNCQRIARIAVVSEASVLEFFKQSGEYETTIFAEYLDEFVDKSVYLATTAIQPPASEASIKFTRTKNKGSALWVYGIKLILVDSAEKRNIALNFVQTFFNSIDEQAHVDFARRILECFNTQEIPSNEQFSQKDAEILTLDSLSNSIENKNQVVRKNREREDSNFTDDGNKLDANLRMYIDGKLRNMEKKLMERMDEIEANTDEKLHSLLERLQIQD